MKRFIYIFIFIIATIQLKSQCFEIQSILVDACAGSQEGQNEMVVFQVGSTPLNTANLTVSWPNNSWLGLTQNAGTANDVATVNATILSCGFLKEPVAGLLPANSKVLLVTSTAWTPLAQSFVNLTDTLYIIFQTAGNTSGHFANFGTGTRTLTMNFSLPVGCSDNVTYDRALLLKQNLTLGAQDGGAVEFSAAGVASYVNHGCQAPYIPLSVDAGLAAASNTVCLGSIQNFTATTSGVYTSINWSLGAGATGTFAPTNSLSTVYTPGTGDNGTIEVYCTILKVCGTQTTTARDSVNLTFLQIPDPVISATTNTLCSGNTSILSYSLTNASSTGTTSVLWSPGSATTSTISVNSANIYSVQVTNLCGNKTATVSITTIPIPSITISASSPTACAGGTVALSAASNVGNFSWNNPVSTNSAVVVSSNTTTTGVVTTTNVCGSDSKTFTLTITDTPTISVSSANVSLCTGQSATVTASSNTTTYTWNPGSINTNTIALNTAGIYTVNTSNVCGTASATVDVVINSVPTVSLTSSSSSLCASGQAATLTLSGSTGTYSWSNGAATSTTSISTPGVYTATVTTPSCGSATASLSIGTAPLPTVSISVPSTTLCSGSSLTFTANSSDANYLWTGGITTQTISVNTSSIVVTTTNACGVAQASQTLNIVPIPTLSVNNPNVTLCTGQSFTVIATSNVPSYTWQPGGITTNSLVVNSAGVYTVGVLNTCGTAMETVSVSTTAAPTLSIVSSAITICAGGQTTATLSLVGSSGTYTWSTGSSSSTTTISLPGVYSASVSTPGCGNAVANISLGTSPLPIISIQTPPSTSVCAGGSVILTASSNEGNYLWPGGITTNTFSANTSPIVVTSTNACGSSQATQTLNVVPVPTVTLSSNAITLCSGQSTTVQANTNTAVTYSWSTGATTNSVSLNTPGVYTVVVTNNCGNALETVTVSSGISPSVSASASQTLLCSGQTATLTAAGSVGTYSWSNGATTPTTTASNSGVYTVTLTNSCGPAVSSVTITSQLTPTVSLSASSSTICAGQTAVLTATSNVSNFSWSNGGSTNTQTISTSGVVTVTVSNSCGVDTASIVIFSNSLPVLNLTTSSTTICPNETATLTVFGGSAPYNWSNTSNTGSVVTTNGGLVTVSNSNVCGTVTETINVAVVNLNANISANPTSGTTPVTVDFTNNSVGANTYFWDFGNGMSANTQTVSSQTYSVVGTYTVYLLVTSGACLDIDSLIIKVLNQEGTLVIPNVFTPNNDSVNDVFRVSGFNIVDFNCTIFDRWGLQMFTWEGIKTGWNGKTNDKEVPAGTYFYIINAKDIDGVEIKKQGTVSLFK